MGETAKRRNSETVDQRVRLRRFRVLRKLWVAVLLFGLIPAGRSAAAEHAPLVGKIRFGGVKTFDRSTLVQLMRTRECSRFAEHRFSADAFARDLDNLTAFYVAEGFLSIRVSAAAPVFAADSSMVHLDIAVDEGARWTLADVDISDTRALARHHLERKLRLKEGDPYKPLLLAVDERAILDDYAGLGYLDARVSPEITLDPDKHTATVSYRIREGPRASVARITIRGLERTKRSTVMRELDFKVGDSFDLARWGRSQSNLYNTGLFDWVWIQPSAADTGSADKEVLVLLGERSRWEISTGVGYGRFDQARLVAGVRQGNFFGRGVRCGLEGKLSTRIRRAELIAAEPWLFGWRLSASCAGSYEWRDEPEFLAETVEGGLLLTRAVRPRVFAEGGYRLRRTTLLQLAESSQERARRNRTSVIGAAVTWKMRDDLFNTTRGFFLRFEAEYAGTFLGGTNQFLRANLFWRHFVRLPGRIVLAFNTHLGAMTPLHTGGKIPINERYFMGGDRSVRGYPRHSLGPREGGRARGARKLVELGQEFRFPLSHHFHGVFFCDEGMLFDGDPRRDDWAVGAGGGLRIVTPFGILRAEVARGLTERWGIGTEYYITVGQAF